MQKTTNEKLKLGVFIITGLLLFVVAIYLIGERQNMFTNTFTISANFNNVNGLLQGNNVRYSGINVGTVKTISMLNDSTINVKMVIEEKMVQHIKKDAIATIGTDGLVGNMIVNIIPGNGNTAIISQGDIIKSYTKIGTDDMLNTLNVTNENAALLTAKLLDIANTITNGDGTVSMLINDSTTAKNVKQTIFNLKSASIETNKTMSEIHNLVKSIDLNKSVAGVLLNDSIEAQKVKSIITSLDESSKDIKKVIKNLDEVLLNIKDGKGALNYLSNDEEFVKNLEQSIKNINEGTEKFNLNMEALKHNFLTRRYFRKLKRQKKNEAPDTIK
ncbi:MlaD family protein [Flavivirga rizhaonensis]|uniref:MCE family protein n=1 Tax=Flavivirga rizhaonensis TaxID=2559571 RepID=A0A4S1E1E2_9FLAO|nr:MlaD family protein [Flavivirga rizhaonensis]TGV04360.1 MCE family protein [Flavivirga rizhaonensis]